MLPAFCPTEPHEPTNHPDRVMRTAAKRASLTAMMIALLALLGPVILPLAAPAPPPSKALS
jgi:hypothetical protein